MAETLNFFESLDHLEPKCPGCGSLIDWGVTTEYDDNEEAHVCVGCGKVLK